MAPVFLHPPIPTPPKELLERARLGYRPAVDELIELCTPRIQSMARNWASNMCAEEELAQVANIALWNGIHGFDPSKEFEPWATTVIKNAYCSALKVPIKRLPTPIPDHHLTLVIDPGATPADLLDLKTARGLLPAREAQVIQMVYDDQMPQTEIGRELGISQPRVTQIHRTAIRCLQRSLAV
jgi:DNA-directed RNA polymerase specialized sigma subunit